MKDGSIWAMQMEVAGRVGTNNDSPSITETMQGGVKAVRKAERGYTLRMSSNQSKGYELSEICR